MASTALPPFEYTPLGAGQMRLLRPTLDGDEVKWSLETSPMPTESPYSSGGKKGHILSLFRAKRINDPKVRDSFYKMTFGVEPYYALSYTWGELTEETYSLSCNERELKIHRNLHEALPYLARRFSDMPVWVDAICINQSDPKEKQMQIPLMNRIYGVAKRVVVWLGKPDNNITEDHTAEAMAMLPRLASLGADEALEDMWRNVKDEASAQEALIGLELPPLSASVWSCVFRMVCSPWFGRLWVVQEFVLAEDVLFLYGHNEIDKDTMEKLWEPEHVHILKKISRVASGREAEREALEMRSGIFKLKNTFWAMDIIINHPQMGWEGEGRYRWYARYLNEIANFTVGRSCYDPRDRVFGVIGMVGDQLQGASILGHLTYERPLAELYTYFFGFIFFHTDLHPQYWHCLHQATRTNKLSGLPSWCPDLARLPPLTMDTSTFGAQEPQHVRWNEEQPREILLRGAVMDSVAVVHPVWMECEDLHVLVARDTTFVEDLLLMAKIATWEEEAAAAVFEADQDDQAVFGDRTCEVPQASLNDFWRTVLGSHVWLDPEQQAYPEITLEDYNEIRLLLRRIRDFVNREEGWLRQLVEAGSGDFKATSRAAKEHLGRDDQHFLEYLDRLDQEKVNEARPYGRFDAFVTAVTLCASDRKIRPITTSQGRFGLGPYSAMEGDTLCVFAKSFSSHMLRLSSSPSSSAAEAQEEGDNKHKCYTLIGETFIQSLSSVEDDPAFGGLLQDIVLV